MKLPFCSGFYFLLICVTTAPHIHAAAKNAIKKRMLAMKMEKENALDRDEQLEQKLRDTEEQKPKTEGDLNNMQKKYSNLENEFNEVYGQLEDALSKLENSEKRVTEMEQEVSSTTRMLRLLEVDLERNEEKLQTATEKLEETSKAANESERGRKVLQSMSLTVEERIDQFLKVAQFIAEDAERKYDEAARKLAITEVELERAEVRLKAADKKNLTVSNKLKSLEMCEQGAAQSGDNYEETIRDLTQRLERAEKRATGAEKLQKDVDRLEGELLAEKERYKNIVDELDQTLAELKLAGY